MGLCRLNKSIVVRDDVNGEPLLDKPEVIEAIMLEKQFFQRIGFWTNAHNSEVR